MNPEIVKQPLKIVEIPLAKFTEEVIPHHQRVFEKHKPIVLKLVQLNSAEQLRQEIKTIKREVKKLKDLMYELDSLRAKVNDEDLDKFDTKTLSLRKTMLNMVTGYTDLQRIASKVTDKIEVIETIEDNPEDPFIGMAQIQLHENLNDIKLRERQQVLEMVEDMHRDVEDLHEVYTQLHGMVERQGEDVDQVEQVTESTYGNVQEGLKQLVVAHRLKAAAYPTTGAVIGGILGGPIGLLAGLKVGSIAALGCALAGYTGGKYFKKVNESEAVESEVSPNNKEILVDGDPQKKE